MRRLVVAAVVVLGACAPKVLAPAPVVTSPKFPEFVRPAVPLAYANSAAAINEARGWAYLQNGDLKTAEHEFTAALKNEPAFLPAEISLGYVELARKDPKAAASRFDRALEQQRDNLSALLGRGHAMLALDRDADAVASFEAALAVDADQPDIRQRVDVLKFRSVEQGIARARQAARAGRLDEAAQAYNAALARSPDSPFLFRELADVERRQGQSDAALEHFRKAVELDPSDAASLTRIGEIFERRGDYDAAAKTYTDVLGIEPSAEVERKLTEVRERAARSRLPAEYLAIDTAEQVTRADLAALIGVRLGELLQGPPRAGSGVITDVRNHWAATWIVAVARAGIIEPFANHAFQPRGIVRRSDLAQAVARLLTHIAAVNPGPAREWQTARLKFTDLSPNHLAYPAASAAVASGVMQAGADNAFQPSRPVTGAEAVEVVTRLAALAGSR